MAWCVGITRGLGGGTSDPGAEVVEPEPGQNPDLGTKNTNPQGLAHSTHPSGVVHNHKFLVLTLKSLQVCKRPQKFQDLAENAAFRCGS